MTQSEENIRIKKTTLHNSGYIQVGGTEGCRSFGTFAYLRSGLTGKHFIFAALIYSRGTLATSLKKENLQMTYRIITFVRNFNLKIMETKLTLRLNDNVIERAKIYARSHKISLSKMIESYLDSITKQKEENKEISITPLVESLSGVINLAADFDYKKEYRDYLEEKYK